MPNALPGLDQKATWLRVKVAQPDWVILRSGGVDTPTALKEAAQVGFPRDKMVGAAPTCAAQEMVQAGEAAIGFICITFMGTETDFPLIREIRHLSILGAKGQGPKARLARIGGSVACWTPYLPQRGSARRCVTSGTSP